MRRRSALYVALLLIVLSATGGGVLAALAWHVPSFYRQSGLADAETRACRSTECLRATQDVWNTIENGLPWKQEFTQEQLNGYLQHEGNHTSAGLLELPDDVRDVRVALDADRVRVGFRYGDGWRSTVVSVEFKVWLVAKETNVIALELCGFRAGALSLGTQAMLDRISDAAHRQNIDVTWYRHGDHPVALLHFQSNQPRPTILLRRLEVQSGRLLISGSPPQDATQPAPPAGP